MTVRSVLSCRWLSPPSLYLPSARLLCNACGTLYCGTLAGALCTVHQMVSMSLSLLLLLLLLLCADHACRVSDVEYLDKARQENDIRYLHVVAAMLPDAYLRT